MRIIDQAWIYTLQQTTDKVEDSGFYVYDLRELVNNGDVKKFKLGDTILGQNGSIEYSLSQMRLSLVEDYHNIIIVPLLHLSTINFFGMTSRKDHLVWKEEPHLFTALDTTGRITTWSKTTGKLLTFDAIDTAMLSGIGSESDIESTLLNYEIYKSSAKDEMYSRNYMDNHQLLV